MKRILLAIPGALGLSMVLARPAFAVCPLCVVAVGAGLGLSRWLGIDDAISGAWIGGLIVALILWTLPWLDRKNVRFPLRDALTVIAYYALTLIPLWWAGILGNPRDMLATGADKLLIGILVGSAAFWFGTVWYDDLKQSRGRALFPFQKIAMPVGMLALMSLALFFITR